MFYVQKLEIASLMIDNIRGLQSQKDVTKLKYSMNPCSKYPRLVLSFARIASSSNGIPRKQNERNLTSGLEKTGTNWPSWKSVYMYKYLCVCMFWSVCVQRYESSCQGQYALQWAQVLVTYEYDVFWCLYSQTELGKPYWSHAILVSWYMCLCTDSLAYQPDRSKRWV